ncbi:MAG: 50S ribosomal protein L29 [bacterium]|nr:50S ribosomal protein L29 [bacterium]
MKAKELRDYSDEELGQKEADLREELFKLRFRAASGQVENFMRIRQVRKDIARVLTVYRERLAERKKQGAGE